MTDTSTRRIYVKAVANGFLIELNDQAYNETVYVFTNWADAVDCINSNPPVFVEHKNNDTPDSSINI